MELYVFRHHEWEQLYKNCSKIDTSPIPWEQRRFVTESLVLMAMATIYYILYIPCIYSFLRNWHDDKGRPNPCYQIMFYISIVDMGALWIISLYSGGQFLAGTVYCSSPTLNYFLGDAATSLIVSETCADVILAFDRCIEILSPYWSTKLFKGKRLWFCWLLPITFYGFSIFWMSSPVVFNGSIFVFTNNPYVGFWDDEGMIFQNSKQLNINESTLFVGTPLIYTLFFICLAIKFKSSGIKKLNSLQKNVFCQVFIISAFNMVAGGLYYLIAHFPGIVSPTLIILAHFSWIQIHGIPPVIYLIFNKKIRMDARILFMKIFRRHRIGHLHGVTVVVKQQRSNPLNQQQPIRMQQNRHQENSEFADESEFGDCQLIFTKNPNPKGHEYWLGYSFFQKHCFQLKYNVHSDEKLDERIVGIATKRNDIYEMAY